GDPRVRLRTLECVDQPEPQPERATDRALHVARIQMTPVRESPGIVALGRPTHQVGTHRQPLQVVGTEFATLCEKALTGFLPGAVQVRLTRSGKTADHGAQFRPVRDPLPNLVSGYAGRMGTSTNRG